VVPVDVLPGLDFQETEMKNENIKTSVVLSKRDATELLDILHASFLCISKSDFIKLIESMHKILPFDSAVCLIGWKSGENKIDNYELINISYPEEWLARYKTKNYHLVDPIVKQNFTNCSIQYWKDTYSRYPAPEYFIKEAEDYNLRRGYSIGQTNLARTEGNLFSIAGNSIEQCDRTELILRHSLPHLHLALSRFFVNKSTPAPILLTTREKEILSWVKEGKSSWDISIILNISEDTVNFHLKNVYRKLDAISRPHAVAVALEKGLIAF